MGVNVSRVAIARPFNALPGTLLTRLYLRNKWMDKAQALCEGLSLNQAAQRLGVAQNTAFCWRRMRPRGGVKTSPRIR